MEHSYCFSLKRSSTIVLDSLKQVYPVCQASGSSRFIINDLVSGRPRRWVGCERLPRLGPIPSSQVLATVARYACGSWRGLVTLFRASSPWVGLGAHGRSLALAAPKAVRHKKLSLERYDKAKSSSRPGCHDCGRKLIRCSSLWWAARRMDTTSRSRLGRLRELSQPSTGSLSHRKNSVLYLDNRYRRTTIYWGENAKIPFCETSS